MEADRMMLEAALEIYRAKVRDIEVALGISTPVKGRRGGRKAAATIADTAAPRKRRSLSAAARKRIAEAQRKRWAEHKKQSGGSKSASKKPTKKGTALAVVTNGE